MSDSEQANEGKKEFKGLVKTPFFTFSKPYLDFIGKGTMFHIVYFLMAAISLLLPIALIVFIAQSGLFDAGGKFVAWFIFTWLFAAFACWIGFQLWWNRRSQITDVKDAEFVVIPIVADIICTFGEWLGTLIAVIGFGGGLFGLIFLGHDLNYMFYMFGLYNLSGLGGLLIIAGPIAGFFIIIIYRALAEIIRIIVSIANSCREIANKNN